MSELDDLASARRATRVTNSPTRNKPKANPSVPKVYSIVLVAVALVVGVVVLGWKKGRDQQQAPARVAVAVGAEQLLRDYLTNEVAADQRYKGKLLDVTGAVSLISRDVFTEQATISLQTPDLIRVVECYFPGTAERDVAVIRKGDVVTIRGEGGGLMLNALLKNCQVLKVGRPTPTLRPWKPEDSGGVPLTGWR